jgi:hypothetical protein
MADQATKKTKITAVMTTVAQKTPIPAITTSWCGRSCRGGTSGMRIFLDFTRNVMEPLHSIFDAKAKNPKPVEAIGALARLLGRTGIRSAIDYRDETACFSTWKIDETDLPGIETTASSSIARQPIGKRYFFTFSSLTSADFTQPTRPFWVLTIYHSLPPALWTIGVRVSPWASWTSFSDSPSCRG